MGIELDETDREIMRYLTENSRTTFVDISKALNISDATVYNRVKRLMEEGVITKFTIEVDRAALGRRTRGFILISVAPGSVKDVSKQLCEIRNVREVYEVHGSE
ncbi:MAG: winged helix-turn-helix transcriptional regulator, partial [Candidatus Bathyarchaeota archaeon]